MQSVLDKKLEELENDWKLILLILRQVLSLI